MSIIHWNFPCTKTSFLVTLDPQLWPTARGSPQLLLLLLEGHWPLIGNNNNNKEIISASHKPHATPTFSVTISQALGFFDLRSISKTIVSIFWAWRLKNESDPSQKLIVLCFTFLKCYIRNPWVSWESPSTHTSRLNSHSIFLSAFISIYFFKMFNEFKSTQYHNILSSYLPTNLYVDTLVPCDMTTISALSDSYIQDITLLQSNKSPALFGKWMCILYQWYACEYSVYVSSSGIF